MDDYTLHPDEIKLLEDNQFYIHGRKGSDHLILTTQNIVLVNKISKAFKKPEITVETYPISDIKIYNDTPQVTQKKETVLIQFLTCELTFNFHSKINAVKFANKVMEAATGEKISRRGADKVKNAIGIVDNTLGINTIGTVTSVLENGIGKTLFSGVGGSVIENGTKKIFGSEKAKNASKVIGISSGIIQNINTVQEQEQSQIQQQSHIQQGARPSQPSDDGTSYEQKISAVVKLKDLLDMGILSQEEFDTKKKEILGL